MMGLQLGISLGTASFYNSVSLLSVLTLSRCVRAQSLHRLARQAPAAPIAHRVLSSKLVKPYLLLKILKYFHTC